MKLQNDGARTRRIVITICAAVLITGAGFWLHHILKRPEQPRQIVHNISLIKQPPPPPPKPPEKPPEPPKVKEEVKIPQEEPKPAERPADQKPPAEKSLGTDNPGTPGNDGFNVPAGGGGNSMTSDGTGTGAYYTGMIQKELHEGLMRNRQLQRQDYKVVVRVLIGTDGRITHSDLVSSSGNKSLDQLIIAALADTPPLRDTPPANLRDVEVRLSNHI